MSEQQRHDENQWERIRPPSPPITPHATPPHLNTIARVAMTTTH